MSHNYKLGDFNIVTESDTDIHERLVSINLSSCYCRRSLSKIRRLILSGFSRFLCPAGQ